VLLMLILVMPQFLAHTHRLGSGQHSELLLKEQGTRKGVLDKIHRSSRSLFHARAQEERAINQSINFLSGNKKKKKKKRLLYSYLFIYISRD